MSGSEPANVLIVGEDPATRLALQTALPDLKCRATDSDAEVAQALAATDFGAVLIDVSAQGAAGLATAQLIRNDPHVRHTPILFLVGDAPFPLRDAYRLGAVDHLAVPFPPEVLAGKVALLVDYARRHEAVEELERKKAELTRDITERKRVEDRQRFLADKATATQPLTDPDEITAATARVLGEHLNADRCAYAEVEPDENHFVVTGDYTRGVPSIIGRYAVVDFGAEARQLLLANLPFVVEDVDTDPRIGPNELAVYRQTCIRAVIGVPLHKGGKFVAGMAVHQATPRRWTADEVQLVQLGAARCWESIERARTRAR